MYRPVGAMSGAPTVPTIGDAKLANVVAGLFGSLRSGDSLYAILDAAQNHEIPVRLRLAEAEHACLYEGPTAEALWYVAPYLVRCTSDSKFFEWLIDAGWGEDWGIFLGTPADLSDLRQHFRRYLIVKVEKEDKDFYFRFYDPRVLRAFLPTCTAEERVAFFGPVRCFLLDGNSPGTVVTFVADQSVKQTERGR